MTEHKATPEQWVAGRYDWSHADTEALHGDPAFRCIMELRDRVEALEAVQQKATVKPATRLHSYRVENSALPIKEWMKGHTIVDSAKPPVTEDAPAPSDSLVQRVADAIYMNAFGGYCEQARAAILAVADWFEQQGSHTAATRLRQEVG